jgi:hypothetical protein
VLIETRVSVSVMVSNQPAASPRSGGRDCP